MSSSGGVRAPVGTMRTVVSTPLAGVAFINGTQTFLTYTVPNDGQQHSVSLFGTVNVTVIQTGGVCNLNYTSAGHAFAIGVFGGSSGVTTVPLSQLMLCDPNTTVTLTQQSAQTAGTASMFAQLQADHA